MRLTFKGFLREYCRRLSGLETDNLKKLCEAANGSTSRVAEPLFLFALEQGKLPYLLEVAKGTWMESGYSTLAERTEGCADAETFLRQPGLPARYVKVWNAYLMERDSIEKDRRITALMRVKTLEALKAEGRTPYRVCKDLNLNMGNVYAYLRKGDVTKVSRNTARRILEYAQAESSAQG